MKPRNLLLPPLWALAALLLWKLQIDKAFYAAAYSYIILVGLFLGIALTCRLVMRIARWYCRWRGIYNEFLELDWKAEAKRAWGNLRNSR